MDKQRLIGLVFAIALFGLVWNLVAAILHSLFGIHLPVIDSGMNPG